MGFDFGIEIGRFPLAQEHGLNLLGPENALDCRRQRIKARLAVIGRDFPLRGNPAPLLEPLQRRIKGSVLSTRRLEILWFQLHASLSAMIGSTFIARRAGM